ncbi:MAG: hypothetical protein JXA79_07835 [Deltaproteobacteria bacterium]|nr:hypothetical protein [Deltaproteobacteria bacterium]
MEDYELRKNLVAAPSQIPYKKTTPQKNTWYLQLAKYSIVNNQKVSFIKAEQNYLFRILLHNILAQISEGENR